MTHKLWQKKLELRHSKSVIDIVQFGSTTQEGKTPNDIDIAVIFKSIPLKKSPKLNAETALIEPKIINTKKNTTKNFFILFIKHLFL